MAWYDMVWYGMVWHDQRYWLKCCPGDFNWSGLKHKVVWHGDMVDVYDG